MKALLLAVFIFSAAISQAQTKRIAHYSHSGKIHNLEAAPANHSPSTNHSNFGDIPTRYVINARLDSLIALDGDRIVMVTSEVCVENREPAYNSVWEAGRDTIKDHPLFLPQMSEKEIDRIIKEQYNFDRENNTVIVGFGQSAKPSNYQAPTYIKKDTPQDSLKKQNLLPVKPDVKQNKPPHAPKFWILLAATFATLVALLNHTLTKTNRLLHQS
jgi:hypothetical protein